MYVFLGKQSPDAFLQMALQLAYHKTHGVPVATYETASTRLFLHGRTDVIRTLSEDSWRWVQAMRERRPNDVRPSPFHSLPHAHAVLGSPTQHEKLYELLTMATKAHNLFTRDSSTGKGCDRHLMGLKLLLREGESHPIFEDPLYTDSSAWVLSTSGLSAGDRFFGTGFGTVWPEGYGINCELLLSFFIPSQRHVADPVNLLSFPIFPQTSPGTRSSSSASSRSGPAPSRRRSSSATTSSPP